MSLKKTLVASTPKCAKMVASNPLIDEDLDSILEDSNNSHLKNVRRNINLMNSSVITESVEEEYETANNGAKTVTPQNEIDIVPEPIKHKRQSSKKPQSRLTNSSLSRTTLSAKDPSRPISVTDVEDRDNLSTSSGSDNVVIINDDDEDECTVVSLTDKNQDNSTLNASKLENENKTKNIDINDEDCIKSNNISNSSAQKEILVDIADNLDTFARSFGSSNQDVVLNDEDTDSDIETPKTRRNASTISTCPNETFKKKLFNGCEEIAATASVGDTPAICTVAEDPTLKKSMFEKKCFVRLERLSVIEMPVEQLISVPESNGLDNEDNISEENQQHKSSSISVELLSKLKPSTSKELYLSNWVDTQNSRCETAETVEIEVNRKYCVTSRTTQITNSDRKRYFESDEESDTSDASDKIVRRQSKRTKVARRRVNPSRVQPRRGTTYAARDEVQEVDLDSVKDNMNTVKRTRKNTPSISKVVIINDDVKSDVNSSDTEADKKSIAIKSVTKKSVLKKAKSDNAEEVLPKKRGRKKKVVEEPPITSSKAATRMNGLRNVENGEEEEPPMPSTVTVRDPESDSDCDSDNIPLQKLASKRKTKTAKMSVEDTVVVNAEPEIVQEPEKVTRKTGARKRTVRESEAAPAVTTKRVRSNRNAKKPVVIDEDQISNVDSVSTKNDDSDNESTRGAKKRQIKRVTGKK